mmetsp:Transcript_3135/g.8850  ORF Transcript_3135/g.8850 Transcript_3135/m.8850 type:complete len:247 (-) Transcript_3135:12-752(-)
MVLLLWLLWRGCSGVCPSVVQVRSGSASSIRVAGLFVSTACPAFGCHIRLFSGFGLFRPLFFGAGSSAPCPRSFFSALLSCLHSLLAGSPPLSSSTPPIPTLPSNFTSFLPFLHAPFSQCLLLPLRLPVWGMARALRMNGVPSALALSWGPVAWSLGRGVALLGNVGTPVDARVDPFVRERRPGGLRPALARGRLAGARCSHPSLPQLPPLLLLSLPLSHPASNASVDLPVYKYVRTRKKKPRGRF